MPDKTIYNIDYLFICLTRLQVDSKMLRATFNPKAKEKITWFSMWFLAAIASFGAAFFPLFYRMVDSRNKHFQREMELEDQIANFLKEQGKEQLAPVANLPQRSAKAWAASAILVTAILNTSFPRIFK